MGACAWSLAGRVPDAETIVEEDGSTLRDFDGPDPVDTAAATEGEEGVDPDDGTEPMDIDVGSDVVDGTYWGTVLCKRTGFTT